MAGVPDPIGGIGYANVFKGNKAIDDLREDIRYNRARKAKEDDAKKAIKLKPTATPVDGWEIYDAKETDLLFQKLQDDAAKLKAEGIDPFTVPEFAATARKAEKLAAENKALQTQFQEGVAEAEKLKGEGKITQEAYNDYVEQWNEIGKAGGKWGQPGGMSTRLDIVREKGLPASPYNLVDLRKRAGELIDVGKVTYETEDGVTTVNPKAYGEQLSNTVDELYDVGVRQGKWKTKDQAAVTIKGWTDETLDRSTTRVKEDNFSLKYNGGGSATVQDYEISYSEYVPKGTKESGLSMAELPVTDAIEFTGKVPTGSITNVQLIDITNDSGTTETVSVSAIDEFKPTRIWKDGDKYRIEGNGVYENADGTNKRSDMEFVVEKKTNKNLIEKNFLGGESIEVVMDRLKKEKTGQKTESKSKMKVGTIEDGYKYIGGDPSNPKSWEEQ